MGKLTVSCTKAEKFLRDHDFKLMQKLKSFKFSDNTIEFKAKVSILRPPVKIEIKSFIDGILHLRIDTSEFIETVFKIFFGTKRTIDEFLLENGLADFIKRKEGKDLEFEILVNPLLAAKANIKGITITNIQLKNKKLAVDFGL